MITSFEKISHNLKDNDHANNDIVRLTENILSASIGAPSARVVILSAFKEKGFNVDDVVSLLSSTSKALKFNRKMLEITMNNISQGISVSDADLNIIGWNSSYEKLMNYPKDFLYIGKPVEEIILFNAKRGFCGPGGIDEHIDKRITHLKSGISYRFERIREDGIVIDIVGNPLPQGGYVTTYADISEYKKIETALLEKEREITLYTDNSPALLAYLDNNLVFRFANKTIADSHNLKKEDIIGSKISDVLSKDELDFKRQYIGFALENRKQQFEYESQDIFSGYYLVTYIPDVNSDNKVIGIYTISQDISNRRKAELALREINTTLEQRVEMRTDELHASVKELESAKAEAERANLSKSKFLAAASHDLLQPFNAARLFNEILMSEVDTMTDKQYELVEKTDSSLNVAENIISSLIDVSKLDSGTIHPNICTFNINDILESIGQSFSGFAEKKNLTFKVLNRNINVQSDPKLLYRVLQNFVSNAIRYTNTGGILISTQKRKDYLRVSVWDTGIGIKDVNQKEIFTEFKQLSDPLNSTIESGIGLGLSISERIAHILDHSIQFNSHHGRGSVFHLNVKYSDEQENTVENVTHDKSSAQSDLTGIKVLCVDNDIHITYAMSLLLQRWGCDVKAVHSENQINDLITTNFIPDILVVDYQLDQGKTGIEFINLMRIKADTKIPAIIVTADHSNEVEQVILNNGHKLLYKPLKPAMLRTTMNNEMRKLKGR
ncbi:MAG: PAS domain-containing protein [Gammaproteobacteria bacterium]|nr:PAS domain-containing protein [Gammaproteobacteria bacterium]